MNETKFDGKGKIYSKYRPTYPEEFIDYLFDEAGISAGCTVADIGSGTGIFSRLLLEKGCTVYGVEPNADMRSVAESEIQSSDNRAVAVNDIQIADHRAVAVNGIQGADHRAVAVNHIQSADHRAFAVNHIKSAENMAVAVNHIKPSDKKSVAESAICSDVGATAANDTNGTDFGAAAESGTNGSDIESVAEGGTNGFDFGAATEGGTNPPHFISQIGGAEATGLPQNSVDFVTAAQAFHWFDRAAFKTECARILKPNGKVVLVWNSRDGESALVRENDQINRKFCPNFKGFSGGIRGEIEAGDFSDFFCGAYDKKSFANHISFDLEGFVGRNLSASYAPKSGDDQFEKYTAALKELYKKYESGGRLTMPNFTFSYVGKVV